MTMLDRMRRHKGWLKWSLALVVLAFVVLYFPEFVGTDQSLMPAGDRLATIDSRSISVADFRRRYMAQVQAYRSSYGGKLTDDLLQQMQVPQQVLQQMIQEKAEIVRGRARRHYRQRRRGARADHGDPRAAGKRAVHRRAALPSAAAAAEPADDDPRISNSRCAKASCSTSSARDSPSGCRCPTPSSSASTSAATKRSRSTSSRCSRTISRRR